MQITESPNPIPPWLLWRKLRYLPLTHPTPCNSNFFWLPRSTTSVPLKEKKKNYPTNRWLWIMVQASLEDLYTRSGVKLVKLLPIELHLQPRNDDWFILSRGYLPSYYIDFCKVSSYTLTHCSIPLTLQNSIAIIKLSMCINGIFLFK